MIPVSVSQATSLPPMLRTAKCVTATVWPAMRAATKPALCVETTQHCRQVSVQGRVCATPGFGRTPMRRTALPVTPGAALVSARLPHSA